MPRWAHNKLPSSVRQRYFDLIRSGLKGSEAARRVGVSTSCGSLWFIDAGSMAIPEPSSISPRFLSQLDRIAIADGLHARTPVKTIVRTLRRTMTGGSTPERRPRRPGRVHRCRMVLQATTGRQGCGSSAVSKASPIAQPMAAWSAPVVES